MKPNFYRIFDRELSFFSQISEELTFNPDTNYLFELEHLGVIGFSGTNSKNYLNGQMTCNISEVTDRIIRQGAFCNLKGRINAIADVIDWAGLKIVLPIDLHQNVKKMLSKTAIFSKVTFDSMSHVKIYGFLLQNKNDKLPLNLDRLPEKNHSLYDANQFVYALNEKFFILIVEDNLESSLRRPFVESDTLKGSLAWHYQNLLNGSVDIYPSTTGQLLPHRIGLHNTGHLSFNKGCYKGQEIIARTHYRAKLKHQLKQFIISNIEISSESRQLKSVATQQDIGEIVDYCPVSDQKMIISASVLIDHPSEIYIDDPQSSISLFDVN